MNQAMHDAVSAMAARALSDPTLTITLTAWAPGTPEDPSSPRRLSLDRALAARAILINAGVPSERIFAVAKGFAGVEGGPADRLDMVAARPRPTPNADMSTQSAPPPVTPH